MSKVSYEEILALRRKVNIVDIVNDYVPLTKRGRNYFGICPFHNEKTPSMSVSPDKQIYKCFGCPSAGDVFSFVMDYEKISYYEAVKVVAEKVGINIDIGEVKKQSIDNPLYNIYDISSKYYQNYLNTASGKIAKKYLKDRNLDDEIIKHFGIGLSPSDSSLTRLLLKKEKKENLIKSGIAIESGSNVFDIYINRIMFPLCDLNGRVVGFSGRIYDDSDTSKYINTKETDIFKKGNLLYNYHNARKSAREEKKIIIVEGFMDVIRLYTIGIENVVATMGTAITKTHADLIRKLAPNVVLMFDGDKAGAKATNSALEELKDTDANIKIVRLEDNLDPDEYILSKGKDKMLYHLEHPINEFTYKCDFYKKTLDFNDANDISKYINLLKTDLEKIDDDIVRDVEIKKISDETRVSIDTIKSKLDIKNKDVKIVTRKKEERQSKYDKASKYILFHMVKNPELIDYYYNNLSFLPNDTDRMLASEMVLFEKKFNGFNVNDFITYLKDKKDLINRIIYINDLDYDEKYTKEEVDIYFDSIKEYLNKREINSLLDELKNTNNEILKREIAQKIVAIKMKEKK